MGRAAKALSKGPLPNRTDVFFYRSLEPCWPEPHSVGRVIQGGMDMGRGILLWLLGVPIPIIILILLFWH